MSVGVDREDVRFASGDGECGGWLYRPRELPTGERRPVVVLAHGLGGDRYMGLDGFARRFAAAGYVALAFDYRHFGDSSGEPRRLLDIRRQRADYRSAVAYVRSRPDVDPDRVVVWGSSFAGGHVLVVAADDPRLAAVISQVPFTDGISSALTLRPVTTAKVTARALADLAGAALRRRPVPVALSGAYGDAALMVAPDVQAGNGRIADMSPTHENAVPARVGLAIPLDRPGRYASRITAPVLYAICTNDSVAPSGPALRAARRTPDATVREYAFGHFDVYPDAGREASELARSSEAKEGVERRSRDHLGEAFEQAVGDQLAFLAEKVPVSVR